MEAWRAGAIVRSGHEWIACSQPEALLTARGDAAFDVLAEVDAGGFWVGYCAYGLGRAIERVDAHTPGDADVPDVAFVRYGSVERQSELGAEFLEATVELGSGRSSLTRAEHATRVRAIHELLSAGECYQVNLTRQLVFDTAPDPWQLFAATARADPAPHAGVCVFGDALPGVAIVCASPEVFLRIDGRAVETRPIKGTDADPARLRASAKDHAENVMIVDLARNDLGRVCEYGSVRVDALFDVEPHPGLHHLVSTVRGQLTPGTGLAGVVRATFPPASVTGAPKPRVMQAIEDLEPVSRGVYCGAFGWIDGDRHQAELAVAIRTFTIADGRTTFGVGGGIVADSRVEAEWAETELKAARWLAAAGAHECTRAPEPAAAR